jgi:hypothetical protein
MHTWGIQGRVLPLFASVPRPVSNAAACRYSELRRSLTKHAVCSWADQVSASSAGQFSPLLHSHPP